MFTHKQINSLWKDVRNDIRMQLFPIPQSLFSALN